MTELVIDASVLLKWFRWDGEQDQAAALALQSRFRSGEIEFVAPALPFLEVLNSAARRWRWQPARVHSLAQELGHLRFAVAQPALERVAHWTNQGLTAYDACYVALAEQRRTVVVTADKRLLSVAGPLAASLADLALPS